MTHDEILLMARDAGFQHSHAVGRIEEFAYFDMYKFAELVSAAEREACAKLCDPDDFFPFANIRAACASVIRARK